MGRAFVRHAGYLVQPVPDCTPTGIVGVHLVVARSWRIEPDGPCRALDLQPPLALADAHADPDDPLGSPLLRAADIGPPKAAVDVVLSGHCHPPGGAAEACEVALTVGPLEKRVLVIGDRTAWMPHDGQRAEISRPRPFDAMPLCWSRAYGGGCDYGGHRIHHPYNPVGTGFWLGNAPDEPPRPATLAMPNLEDPRRPIQVDELRVDPGALDAARRPVGLGPIPLHWMPRAQRGGLDPRVAEWMQATTGARPTLREADPRVYNAAPDDQQIEQLDGTAPVRIRHVRPDVDELRFRLPGVEPDIRWGCNRQPPSAVPLRLATVAIDTDRLRLSLSWRGTVPFTDGPRLADDIERMRIVADGEPILPASLVDSGFPLRLLSD